MLPKIKIAVASGKGGTGKTTVSTALATALHSRGPVSLLDCDVEEPNDHLLLGIDFDEARQSDVPSIEIDNTRCTGCGKCAQACRFNCIACLGEGKGTMFFAELCHGCMGCVIACPEKCITETTRRTGEIRTANRGNLQLVSGLLDVGRAMATGLIENVRKSATAQTVILDSPPGTSCPMLASVRDCDFIVLVTEPTPFGLNDLTLAVAALRQLSLPFGVVINRNTESDNCITQFCQQEGIEILTTIADSLEVAQCYSRGEMPYRKVAGFTAEIDRLVARLIPQEATA